MIKEYNDERLRNGIIVQDKESVRLVMFMLFKSIKKYMDSLIRKIGCKCKTDEILASFLEEQVKMIREDIIHKDWGLLGSNFKETVNNRCTDNLRLYETLVLTDDQVVFGKMKTDAKEAILHDFSVFWNTGDVHSVPPDKIDPLVTKFTDIQFKKFRVKLKTKPDEFFDISHDRFIRYARRNLLDCKEINDLIMSKAKLFVTRVFYQKEWYKNDPDHLKKITEDIVGEAILGFYELISRKYIGNPVGLLNTICYRRVVDHYYRYRIKAKNKREPEETDFNRSLSAEISFQEKEALLNLQGEDLIPYWDLLDILGTIENGCHNTDHRRLFRMYLDGWDYEEISGILGYTHDTAKQIVHNIKKKIRTRINRNELFN